MRRRQTVAGAVGALALLATTIRPAYALNCVNVVLRDPYWGAFRAVIQTGGMASGVAESFASYGFVVNETPSVGAIMSWPAGQYGAAWSGHVGVVDAVHENGTVLVRHENWNWSPEQSHVMLVRPGHRFVHRRPADAAPTPVPAPPPVPSPVSPQGTPAPQTTPLAGPATPWPTATLAPPATPWPTPILPTGAA